MQSLLQSTWLTRQSSCSACYVKARACQGWCAGDEPCALALAALPAVLATLLKLHSRAACCFYREVCRGVWGRLTTSPALHVGCELGALLKRYRDGQLSSGHA